jgi:4-hydroxy 2-oxovalerate aldolase
MGVVKILDCTLRDGGCVNNFAFGQANMSYLKQGLEETGVDVIELGYLNDAKGTMTERTQFDSLESAHAFLGKRADCLYMVMVDVGTFDVNRLAARNPAGVDGIRLAFHKKDIESCVAIGQQILEKGYLLLLQPMITKSYQAEEITRLFDLVNRDLPSAEALYIVDSFGQMKPDDVQRFVKVFEDGLVEGIAIGFHAHDNLGLALENTRVVLDAAQYSERNYYLDASLGGMGKGAGNVALEDLLLLADQTASGAGAKRYHVTKAIEIAEGKMKELRTYWSWGPCEEFRLCSELGCTPSYVGFLKKKGEVSLTRLNSFLRSIPPEERIAFNGELAERLYKSRVEIGN